MDESITKLDAGGAVVTFELVINAANTEVFELLTTNAGLAKWFNELEIGELGADGHLLFVMTPEEKIKMPILVFEPNQKLAFEWDQDEVAFELNATEANKTKLTFTEQLTAITEHSPRDISGWHICLKKLQASAEGKTYDFNKAEFESLFAKYQKELNIEK
ncbi:SRPBCC family protein [Listeria cossartiae subsp. cayugensis]|uniref:SRPBCC family protein n=1 Tax=Listeria cossartiae subsp. cayugensis TaxID=2713505 RepID=A0ABU2IMC9_9LIST|nr:SRPBCC family protein [Listeria cossartiae]MDT0001108.1 SRPBCC family protein [Listeria cossartiae subsp. cayugensis]MDT0009670.1 SRPBCC family protein [Listeria cossartiae subsp. cayugensis]MDT0014110.1 SRPBCC family protein [Listeria cossartiae subsp. cayugensis]MDT0031138.1 SRPBCC family protein [Listeria cossartiae subsp. cayugensis]MDT0039254.1 SRPBCC family protein [Listeria cossartiae subsp. cayugensis]